MQFLKRMIISIIILTIISSTVYTNLTYASLSDPVEQKDYRQIVIKFKNEFPFPYEDGLENRLKHEEYDEVLKKFFSELPNLSLKRLFTSASPDEIQALNTGGTKTANTVFSNLLTYYTLQVPENVEARTLLEKIKVSPLIEDVYITNMSKLIPPNKQLSNFILNPYANPRFINQGYLKEAPYGIDALYAWDIPGGDGKNMKYIDIEYGWLLNHEDLVNQNIELVSGRNIDQDVGHGTSVLGVISSEDNEIGTIGIAPKAQAKVISEIRDNDIYNTADAILDAIIHLDSGDILLLEAQASYDGYDELLPLEVRPDLFDIIRFGTDKGIVIIEAGANGGFDLDQFKDREGKQVLNRNSQDFKDSGAIMVAASTSTFPHQRMDFSNYGSRMDVYGWGENVETPTAEQSRIYTNQYTSYFNGTSSASPIIAGAAISLQSIAKEFGGPPYSPNELRALLSNPRIGTPSNNSRVDKIGVLPNLKAILSDLDLPFKTSYSESNIHKLH